MPVALALWSGCTRPDPSQAFDAVALAAEQGDEEAFLDGLTVESRALVDALLHLPRRRQEAMKLGFDEAIRAKTHHIQGDGQLAIVAVASPAGEEAQVFMRQEDGHWRLDLMSTELLWNRRWELSGGKPRGFPDWFDPTLSLPQPLDNP